METQEWLTSNQQTAFPFQDTTVGAGAAIPQDLFVDLRIFLNGSTEIQLYLGTLQYQATPDLYTLTFYSTATGAVLLTGSITRTDAGNSRVFLKTSISSGASVALFTPGRLWDTPSWNGGGDWTKNWTPAGAAIEPSLVNPGPQTFTRIMIDGVADPGGYVAGGVQSLVAGYNIAFGKKVGGFVGSGANSSTSDTVVEVACVPGSGSGFPPVALPGSIGYVATLNGAAPDQNGNLTLNPKDCLRVFQPKVGAAILPSTLLINSDCLPCCPCQQYLFTSRALERRSAKILDLTNTLNTIAGNSSTAYANAASIINGHRKPFVVVRNIKALGSHVLFTVQNMTNVPIYAYIAFDVVSAAKDLGTVTSPLSNLPQVSEAGYGTIHQAIEAHRGSLIPLPYSVAENPGSGFPITNFTGELAGLLVCCGSLSSTKTFTAIPAGSIVEGSFTFPLIDALLATLSTPSAVQAASVAGALPTLKFRSVAVYGASLCYACASETYTVQVQVAAPATPDAFTNRLGTAFASNYRSVPV